MSKQAIVLVSFGVSMPEVRAKSIDQLFNLLKCSFPDCELRLSFSSEKIRDKLARLNQEVPANLSETMESLHREGYEQVWVLPTHIIAAHEWEKLAAQLGEFEASFSQIRLMDPLFGKQEDYRSFVQGIAELYPLEADELLVLMGHGTDHSMNLSYAALGYEFVLQNQGQVLVAALEGYPNLHDLLALIQSRPGIRTIHLAPLLFVAGDHAQHDMAGDDEDSWACILRSLGYDVKVHLVGLGELPFVHEMYIQKLKDSMLGRG